MPPGRPTQSVVEEFRRWPCRATRVPEVGPHIRIPIQSPSRRSSDWSDPDKLPFVDQFGEATCLDQRPAEVVQPYTYSRLKRPTEFFVSLQGLFWSGLH